MPVKVLSFGKVAGLQPATLQKNELLHRYFSKLLPTLQEQLFSGTTLKDCFWVFTERYFRASCNKFYYLFPYIKTMEWNKRRQNFNGQIKKKPHTVPVNRVETDLLQNEHDKHECYHNLLGWEVLPLNFTQPSPTKTFIRW